MSEVCHQRRDIPIALPVTGVEEWEATRACFETGWLTQGPRVSEFETAFARRHQVSYAIATTSCTTGLHLALATLGIGPGDEVIVPAFTWVATANVVLYCGASPVLVDIDPKTFNIDPQQVQQKLTERTKAILPVHLFGLCADMDALRSVLPPHVQMIEDAACAVGAVYKGRSAGALGDVGVFSFHPRKTITTGEGGMVTTSNTILAEQMIQRRNHGASLSEEERHHQPKPFLLPNFDVLGFNYRMTDIQGAVGSVQLQKLDMFLEERRHWAAYYTQAFSEIDWLQLPPSDINGTQHGWQSYVVSILPDKSPLSRNAIMEILQAKGISTRPGTHAVHMLGYYQDRFGFKDHDFPNARFASENSMALPLHNQMTAEDYDYVVQAITTLGRR